MEKSYKDFSQSAKRGILKYGRLSSLAMREYQELYEAKTGKRSTNIENKEHFYSWVSRNTIRNKTQCKCKR